MATKDEYLDGISRSAYPKFPHNTQEFMRIIQDTRNYSNSIGFREGMQKGEEKIRAENYKQNQALKQNCIQAITQMMEAQSQLATAASHLINNLDKLK